MTEPGLSEDDRQMQYHAPILAETVKPIQTDKSGLILNN